MNAVPLAGPGRRALILAGGGMRVAWQAGVLVRLEEEGLTFAHADGTSGGILTLGMLLSGVAPDRMCDRWRSLDVSDVVSLLPLHDYLVLPSDLPAAGDADGLRERVYPHLGIEVGRIRAATGITATFNVCNFDDKTVEAIEHTDVDVDLLVAGMSLPVFMPAVRRRGTTYTDAVWIKDANLLEAVRRGCDELWVLWCIGNTPRYGDGPMEQYIHMIEMSANGALFAEFDAIRAINERRRAGEAVHGSLEPVRVHVVAPERPLPYDPDLVLGRIDTATLIAMGYRDAHRCLTTATPMGAHLDHRATQMREPRGGVRFTEDLAGHIRLDDGGSGDLRLELSVEIHDLDAFGAGAPADVCGRVTSPMAERPVYVRAGTCRVRSEGDATEIRYRLEVRHDGRPSVHIAATKLLHDDPGFDAFADVTTAAVEIGMGEPGTGPAVGRGELRVSARSLGRSVRSIQPLGARSTADRMRLVVEAGRRLFGHTSAIYR